MLQQQAGHDEGEEGRKQLSRASAPSVGTTVTDLARAHSADRTPRSLGNARGFLAKYQT